ncbi:hypothetical protein GGI43DRAFT_48876 [Trichoderma evansii]
MSTKTAKQVKVVDSIPGVKALLDILATINISPAPLDAPCLYFDVEGTNLGRNGTIAIISLFVLPNASTYIIDIYTLGSAAFTTKGRREYTLRSILESPNISKVFFDVRNDSDALFRLFGISLAGVQDLQLMELAANIDSLYPRRYVSGLSKCIEKDLSATQELKGEWLKAKAVHLAELWKVYATKICKPGESGFWRYMVRKSTMERVELSQSETYNSQERENAKGPWDYEEVDRELDDWNDDVMMLGVNDTGTLKELSFGIFQWVW